MGGGREHTNRTTGERGREKDSLNTIQPKNHGKKTETESVSKSHMKGGGEKQDGGGRPRWIARGEKVDMWVREEKMDAAEGVAWSTGILPFRSKRGGYFSRIASLRVEPLGPKLTN
jgi:hypothetical protein